MARGKFIVGSIALVALLGVGYWQYHDQLNQMVGMAPATQQQASTMGGSAQKAGGAGTGGKRAAFPTLVKLDTVKKSDFPLIERNYGNMASPNVVSINARVASQITKVNVQDGQMVKAGDILVELDDRALQATLAKDVATMAKDQSTLVNANTTLTRAQTLFSKNAGPQQDVDSATAAQQAAQKTVEADQAVIDADKVQLDFAKVRAPFDGKLGAVNATLGQLVAASTNSTQTTALMTITQMQPLKVTFRLPEQVLPNLRTKMDSNGMLPTGDSAFTVRVFASGSQDLLDTGKLTFIDSSVDANSGTIGLAGEVANSKLTLWPGQQVDVELDYGTITGALTVQSVAVQQGQIGSYVWVVDDQNKVKATPVKVSRYEGAVAAIDGVPEGTKVVIEGQAKLADGAEIRIDDGKQKPQQQGGAAPGSANAGGDNGVAQAATPDQAMKKKNATDTQNGTTQP